MTIVASVSNGSKFPGQFRVQFQPGTEPLQRVSTQTRSSKVNISCSNYVFEF
jgi:hypothetical protein